MDLAKIQSVIESTRPVQKTGKGFRVCNMRHPDQYRKPLDGGGANFSAGRFHVKGLGKVTYIAKDIRTALLEGRKASLHEDKTLKGNYTDPFVVFSVNFNCRKVLDLTDENLLDDMGITLADTTGHWWLSPVDTITQIVGTFAYQSNRFDAISYRSARNSVDKEDFDDEYDTNLAVFSGIIKPGSYVEAIAPKFSAIL